MGSEVDIELIERYLAGELSGSELAEFEARLAYDAEFREKVNQLKELESGIASHFRDKMKSKFSDIDRELDQPEKTKTISVSRRMVSWTVRIAAVLVIGFFAFRQYNSHQRSEIAETYWPLESGLPVKMSTKGKYDAAMSAFKLEEWETAASEFDKIDSDTATYFQGISLYKSGEQTAGYVSLLIIPRESVYSEKARFMAALIAIEDGRSDQARVLLKELLKSPQFGKKSSEVLKKI